MSIFHRRCQSEITFLREQLDAANKRIADMIDPMLAQRQVAAQRIRAIAEAELLKAKEATADGEERRKKLVSLSRSPEAIARARGFTVPIPTTQEAVEALFEPPAEPKAG